MANTTTWQLLFVDDDEQTCSQVKQYLEDETVAGPGDDSRVTTVMRFAEALESMAAHRFDVLILDVRLGSHDGTRPAEAGITTLEAIRRRCFVPVVFYTALPELVRHLEMPPIWVVEKTEGLPRLLETVRDVFATRLPAVNRALVHHLEAVQRDYMWDFVSANWRHFGDTSDRTALAYLLARRLALSLSGRGIQQLAQELGDPAARSIAQGLVHPMQYYIMPPVEPSPLAGNLYQGQIGEQTGYWAVITPSCDLVAGREKAERVVLARCLLLSEQPECHTWRAGLPEPSGAAQKRLEDLLRNNRQDSQRERFYFLPGAIVLPDLLVDFQQLVALSREQLNSLDRRASLDSPFADALLARFTRYFGRLGTPDLDVRSILSRLRAEALDGAG